MIVDIPSSEEFHQTGRNLLFAAWEQLFDLFLGFRNFEVLIEDERYHQEKARYWDAAKQTLTNSYSIVHQAIEFFLKGRISEVSPYLLISGTPSTWPKRCDKENKSFADFRTINSEDLIRVHNSVHKDKLSDKFQTLSDELRVRRNRIMHTVDRSLKLLPEELVPTILQVHDTFLGPGKFCDSLMHYLHQIPEHSIEGLQEYDGIWPYVVLRVHEELSVAIEHLSSSQASHFFNFSKRKEAFWCPQCRDILECLDHYEPDHDFDDLRSYQEIMPESDQFMCFVCKYKGKVIYRNCDNEDCDGKKLDQENGRCLKCGND